LCNPVSTIHCLCSFLWPFQWTKNWVLHFCFLWFYISLTLYSSSLSIISSSSAVYMYCLLNWSSLYHVSRSLLNMLWIAHLSSSFSWNVSWPIFFVILKDPYLFWFSFLESHVEWIFLAPSHTLLSSFKSCRFHLFLSNYFFIASFTTFIDFFTAFNFFAVSQENFLALVILSSPLDPLSIDVFWSLVWIGYIL